MPSARPAQLLALGLIVGCLAVEAVVLRVGIDDLDEGYFVQQGLRVLHGQVPLRDYATLYSPGLAYVHAAVFGALGGPFVMAPRLLAWIFRAGLALLLLIMTRPLVRQPLWAAVPGVFLLVALDDAPVLWEPHPGWPSSLFAVLAAWCLSHRPTATWLTAAGAAAALAFAFKQNTGGFIVLAMAGRAAVSQEHRLRRAVVPGLVFATLSGLWVVPLVIAARDDLTRLGPLIGAVNQAALVAPPELPLLVPLAALTGGLWLARRERDPRLWWYLGAGAAIFLTEYPRLDALHLVWSAPLLLVSGAVVLDRLRPATAGLLLLGAFGLAAPTVGSRVAAILAPRVAIGELRYASGIEVPEDTRADLQGVVADILARTAAGQPIFVYPTSPLLYALADRPNPTRFDHLNPGAADGRQIAQVIADLQASEVRLIVISDFWVAAWGPPGPNAALETWLGTRFVEVARYGTYRVLTAAL